MATERRKSTFGGYDYKFVGTIPSKYICIICTKVLRDAHLTSCCGQHFCSSCLAYWLDTLQGKKVCPHCRKQGFQHMKNKERVREVNELRIHCTKYRDGCSWVGELGELKCHLDVCDYVMVTCPYEGCGEKMKRLSLPTHMTKRCFYRPYECVCCGYKDVFWAITGITQLDDITHVHSMSTENVEHRSCHYSVCPEYPQMCPNKCGKSVSKRKALPDHRTSCLLETLDCPFKAAGCTERILRKNLQTHLQDKCYYRSHV